MCLFHIAYETNNYGKGVAAVVANNSGQAEQVLKTQGELNGTPKEYKIVNCIQVDNGYVEVPTLLSEMRIKVD